MLALLAQEADWRLLSRGPDYKVYYDRGNMAEREKGVYRISVFSRTFEIVGKTDTKNAIILYNVEHDCNKDLMRLYDLTYYDEYGKERVDLLSVSVWQDVPKGTQAYELHRVVCEEKGDE